MSAEPRDGTGGFLPILHWLPRYERRWLRVDLIAGVAVVAMIVPKNLGYAEIAGVPVQNGLYARLPGRSSMPCSAHHARSRPVRVRPWRRLRGVR